MPEKIQKNYLATYTKPALRTKLKEKIKKETKGGKSNQWSARKSQLLNKEYEAQGGDYKNKGQKIKSQESLSKWTKEDWQTSDKKPARRKKITTRYLPKSVWEKLPAKEQKKANKTKIQGSKGGKRSVKNTPKTRKVMKKNKA